MAKEGKVKRKYTTITIPTPIFEKIQSKIKNTGFSSVSDYVTYILRETGSEAALESKKNNKEDRIIAKLKTLGYIKK